MQLHIPQPCNEDWTQMMPDAGGRHCAQCATTVIDFTEMSGEEIALYMQLNAGHNVCGRFREDQLGQDLPTPHEFVVRLVRAPLSLLRQIAAIIVFALFATAPASAQNTKHSAPQSGQHNNSNPNILTGDVAYVPQAAPQTPQPQHRDTSRIMGRIPLRPIKKGQVMTGKPVIKKAPSPKRHQPLTGVVMRADPPTK